MARQPRLQRAHPRVGRGQARPDAGPLHHGQDGGHPREGPHRQAGLPLRLRALGAARASAYVHGCQVKFSFVIPLFVLF